MTNVAFYFEQSNCRTKYGGDYDRFKECRAVGRGDENGLRGAVGVAFGRVSRADTANGRIYDKNGNVYEKRG